jgi:hypothetical protein
MKPMNTHLAYIPKRMEATTPKAKAQAFNKWAKKLMVSEVTDK